MRSSAFPGGESPSSWRTTVSRATRRPTAASLPVYFEYAHQQRSVAQWFEFDRGGGSPHALYAATNLIAGPLAISAEWKDYQRFRLGTNDPPSLVREHTFALLNRATHVLMADDEHGFQVEAASDGAEG